MNAISGSLFSEIANSPSAANQFVTDLNQLAQDLQSGNLSGAQQDYVTLSQDALNGVTSSSATSSSSGITASLLSSIASSPSSASSFVGELNQLGSDLSNGDLSSAQGDMLSLDSTALNAAPATSSAASSAASSTTSTTAEIKELVSATMQAIEAGDDSVSGTDMSQLAEASAASPGASYLASASANFGSSSSLAALQGLNADSSSGSSSVLSLLA